MYTYITYKNNACYVYIIILLSYVLLRISLLGISKGLISIFDLEKQKINWNGLGHTSTSV